jgi:hypothetical protein
LLVSVGDRDFTDTFGEAGALARRLREEHGQSASELVRELAGARGSGFGFTASAQKVEAETLDALRSATALLAAKAPDEADAYRQLVLDVADSVANAKGASSRGRPPRSTRSGTLSARRRHRSQPIVGGRRVPERRHPAALPLCVPANYN